MNATVTSAEIRKATGLSQKTLTRWHKGGHIPKPEVGQHPSGRGKMGYYPKHVLALVRRIVALKKEGQPLKQAASQAGHEFEQRRTPGRPNGLDPVTIEAICEGVRLGLPNRDAALRAGVSAGTFYSWIRQAREPDATDEFMQFLESLERSRSDPQSHAPRPYPQSEHRRAVVAGGPRLDTSSERIPHRLTGSHGAAIGPKK